MSGGWHPDPSGRFGQRYFDGSAWTAHVVGAHGQTVQDPLPPRETPYPPPPSTPPSAVGAPAPPPYGAAPPGPAPAPQRVPHPPGHGSPYGAPPPYRPGPPRFRYSPGIGLAVAAIGLVLAAVCLLGAPWYDGGDSSFLDQAGAVRDAGADAVGDDVRYGYYAGGGLVLLGAAAVLVALACVPLPPSSFGNTGARVVGAVLTGAGAVWHTYVVAPAYHLDDPPGVVPLLAVAGFLLAGLGMALGARRRQV